MFPNQRQQLLPHHQPPPQPVYHQGLPPMMMQHYQHPSTINRLRAPRTPAPPNQSSNGTDQDDWNWREYYQHHQQQRPPHQQQPSLQQPHHHQHHHQHASQSQQHHALLPVSMTAPTPDFLYYTAPSFPPSALPSPSFSVSTSPSSSGRPPAAVGQQAAYAQMQGPMSAARPLHQIAPAPSSLSHLKKEVKRRTKTGCLTCRKRRIKCDERHPTCTNCTKSKRICLGYDPTFRQHHLPAVVAPSDCDPMTLPPLHHHQQPPHEHQSNGLVDGGRMNIANLLHDDDKRIPLAAPRVVAFDAMARMLDELFRTRAFSTLAASPDAGVQRAAHALVTGLPPLPPHPPSASPEEDLLWRAVQSARPAVPIPTLSSSEPVGDLQLALHRAELLAALLGNPIATSSHPRENDPIWRVAEKVLLQAHPAPLDISFPSTSDGRISRLLVLIVKSFHLKRRGLLQEAADIRSEILTVSILIDDPVRMICERVQ